MASGGIMVDNGKKVSQPLLNDHGRPAAFASVCQSRAVMSIAHTKPAMCSEAFAAFTFRAGRPITTPNSTAMASNNMFKQIFSFKKMSITSRED